MTLVLFEFNNDLTILLAHYSLSLIFPDQPIKFLWIIFSFAIWLIAYVINFVFLALSLLEFPCPLPSAQLVGFEARCHSKDFLSLFYCLIPPFLCLPLSWFGVLILELLHSLVAFHPLSYMGGNFEFLHDWQTTVFCLTPVSPLWNSRLKAVFLHFGSPYTGGFA